jgi:glycosyltransferase involved in cell wall biosynthesis
MNGVDAELFQPRDRAAARATLGLGSGPLALYVGNLKEVKGVMDLAEAWPLVLRALPGATLAVVGDGPLKETFVASVASMGARVHLAGGQPLDQIPIWMAAADVIVLPSRNEGTPNVVLEAFASGRRVVASRVGGVPDLITRPELGALAAPRDPAAFAAAVVPALQARYDAAEVARLGARGGWAASAAALHAVLVDATVGSR